MATFNVTAGGHRCTELYLVLPWRGVGSADIAFADEVQLDGSVALSIGELELACIVDVDAKGTFADRTRARLLQGAGGWRKTVGPHPHHNDAGVRRRDVAELLATVVGETVSIDAVGDEVLGVDFTREAGQAARIIDQAFPSSTWWINPDGTTRIGARPTTDVTGKIEVLDVDPRGRSATIVTDDLRLILPGASFSDPRLVGTFVIHDLEVWVQQNDIRARAWAGADNAGELAALFSELVRDAMPRARFFGGPFRYRVVQQVVDRLYLQAVDRTLGLPDLPLIGMVPGVAGAAAKPALGSVVLVDFIEGNPSMPIVRGFTRKDDAAHLPLELDLNAEEVVRVGKGADMVELGSGRDNNFITAGRVVCYGDTLLPPTLAQVNGALPYTVQPHTPGVNLTAKVKV